MATLTVKSKSKPAQKPVRSLTYPLREPKNGSPRQCKNQNKQIDPNELRRKLEAHLAGQKKQTEQRRAKAIANKETTYHHVPKVAAASFERTTTPVYMGENERKKYLHKLAQIALKHCAEETTHPTTSSLDLRRTQTMGHARQQRDLLGDRNQFQWTRLLEDTAQLDKEKSLNKVPQGTFGADHLDGHQMAPSRPLSAGDPYWEEYFDGCDPILHSKPEAKQDWEQRDELPVEVHRSVKERVSPFLRKTDSMWMLKSKREAKADELPETNHPTLTSDGKIKKSAFMGLFTKR